MHLTPREQYIDQHPDMTWEALAGNLRTTIGAVQRSYERLEAKRRATAAYDNTLAKNAPRVLGGFTKP